MASTPKGAATLSPDVAVPRVKSKSAFKAPFAGSFGGESAGVLAASQPAPLSDGIRSCPVVDEGGDQDDPASFAKAQSHAVRDILSNLDSLKVSLDAVQNSLEGFAERVHTVQGPCASSSSKEYGTRLEPVQAADISSPGGLWLPTTTPTMQGTSLDSNMNAQDTGRFIAEALPLDWPRSLNMRKGVDSLANSVGHGVSKPSNTLSKKVVSPRERSHTQKLRMMRMDSVQEEQRRCVEVFLQNMREPDSRFRSAWKFLNAAILLYEAVLVPYLLGFSVAFEGWVIEQLVLMAIFWSLDLCLNFVQGFYKDGVLVTDLRLVIVHYLKTGFALDAFVVILDWTTLAIIWSNRANQLDFLARITRVLRLVRMAGLLRLQKLAHMVIFQVLTADVDGLHSVAGLVGMIIGCTALFNHIQVCIWAYIGWNAPSDTGSHWVDTRLQVGDGEQFFEDLNRGYQYTCIFHWHMAQLTVGNQEIPTASSLERIVNIIGLIIALLIACTVVSMLSATLVGFQFSARQRTQQLRVLESYLRENNVSRRMRATAMKQARDRVRRSAKLHEKDVQILGLLSTSLRSQLCYEIAAPVLHRHPLLDVWTRLDNISAVHLSVVATGFEIILPHEMLFQAAEEAKRACFICGGKGEYRQYPRSFRCEVEQAVEVGHGIWLSEAVLWANWIHVGSLEAWTPLEVFVVNVQQWVTALPTAHTPREVIFDYAVQFYRRLINAAPPLAPWPDDLEVPFTEYGSIVCAMARSSQEVVGLDALAEANYSRRILDGKLERLESQLLDGKCILYLDSGQLKRVTSGVSLSITHPSHGKTLYQIGKMKDDLVSISMMIPGHMSERDELPVESVKRLLGAKLQPLAGEVELLEAKYEVETRKSMEFGVLTDYLQLKFAGSIEAGFEIPTQFCVGDNANLVTLTSVSDVATCSSSLDPLVLPETFIFPGEKKNSGYFFTWLTEQEYVTMQGKPDFVVKWLACAFREFTRNEAGRRRGSLGDDSNSITMSGNSVSNNYPRAVTGSNRVGAGLSIKEGSSSLCENSEAEVVSKV